MRNIVEQRRQGLVEATALAGSPIVVEPVHRHSTCKRHDVLLMAKPPRLSFSNLHARFGLGHQRGERLARANLGHD